LGLFWVTTVLRSMFKAHYKCQVIIIIVMVFNIYILITITIINIICNQYKILITNRNQYFLHGTQKVNFVSLNVDIRYNVGVCIGWCLWL